MTAADRWSDPYRAKPDPRAAVTRHRSRLLALSGVVSVGIGFDSAHRTVVIVGVTDQEAAIAADVPGDLDGVPVEIRVVGELGAQRPAPRPPRAQRLGDEERGESRGMK